MTAPDPILARVEEARSGKAFRAAWKRACVASGLKKAPKKLKFRVTELHYRPGVRARLTFVGQREGRPRRRYFFLQIFPDLESAQARLRSAQTTKPARRTLGPAVFLVAEWCAVVWELPGGPRLRVVRSFLQRKAFQRTLDRIGFQVPLGEHFELPELLRYVPRKRAVFRWPVPGADEVQFLKLYEPGADQLAAANLAWLARHRGELAFSVPALRFHLDRRRVIFMEGLPGEVLTHALERGELQILGPLGVGLASLHRVAPELDRSWSAQDQLEALERALGDVRRAMPDLAPRIMVLLGTLRSRLPRPQPERLVPIHGNLFGDQILVDASGALGIVDWDDLTLGDREFDLARLKAHALFLDWIQARGRGLEDRTSLEPLFEAYAQSGASWDPAVLTWYTVGCLMMRAKISALRKLAPGWPELIERSLEEAERLLAHT